MRSSEAIWTSEDGGTDNNLFVRFHMGASLDAAASKLAGCPKFKDVPYITIANPGDKSNVIDREVWDDENNPKSDTQRFAKAWAAWKSGHGDDIVSGTPLSEWAAVTRAQVEELAFWKIRTVEQLASLSDANSQKFMGSLALRQKAQDWLRATEKARPFAQIRAELAEKDEALAGLRDELQSLRAAMTEGKAPAEDASPEAQEFAPVTQAALDAEPGPRRRGRPRKETEAP